MGFFGALGKILQGKPVFEAPKGKNDWSDSDDAPSVSYGNQPAPEPKPGGVQLDSSGQKIIPEVRFGRIECREDGTRMTVWAYVANTSKLPLKLESLGIVGSTVRLERPLSPGEERQVQIYAGERPTHTHYDTATLRYREEEGGDYFEARYYVEYDEARDERFNVEELRLIEPVKDI